MSQKSPLAIVNETFGAKDKLVDKLVGLLDRGDESKDLESLVLGSLISLGREAQAARHRHPERAA